MLRLIETNMHLTCILLLVSISLVAGDATPPAHMQQFFFPGGGVAVASGKPKPSQAEVDEARSSYEAGDFSKYLPTPVQEPDCYVYVEHTATVREPGRCVKLGGRVPACQGDGIMNFNEDECS